MENLIKQLAKDACKTLMDESVSKQLEHDRVYLTDCQDADELESRYVELPLTRDQRLLINDYIACLESKAERVSQLSYRAGICDAVLLLNQLNLLNLPC